MASPETGPVPGTPPDNGLLNHPVQAGEGAASSGPIAQAHDSTVLGSSLLLVGAALILGVVVTAWTRWRR